MQVLAFGLRLALENFPAMLTLVRRAGLAIVYSKTLIWRRAVVSRIRYFHVV